LASVSIRGYGIVSTYGVGSASLVAGLRSARADPVALSNAPLSALADVMASPLPHGSFSFDVDGLLDTVMAAATEALENAAARAPLGDCAVLFGANTLALAEHNYLRYRERSGGVRPVIPHPGALAERVARKLGAGGPVLTFFTACSSSANALLHARELILRGDAARALVIGIESLAMITLSGFRSLMMLDAQGCRPFDAERRGFHPGEGVAALLLERDGDGARVLGGANFCDIHHVTSASPDGSGMARSMRAALDNAGVGASSIAAIKAHATASSDNDSAEAAAMRSVFGAAMPPFTALKRYLGHTSCACGAMETVAFIAALRDGFIPAAAGFSTADPALGCAPMTQALPARPGNYLLNFFGFGGNYASVVIGHG
jgi:3-oxoacyl-(acyl-carrier-protein) synthase